MSSENSRNISNAAQKIKSSPYRDDAILCGFSSTSVRGILARLKSGAFVPLLRARFLSAIEIERNYGSLFLILVSCFGLGAAGYLALPFDPRVWVIPCVLILLLLLAFVRWMQRGLVSAAMAIIIASLLGAVAVQVEVARLDTIILDSAVTTNIRGTIERREIDHRGFWRYGLRVKATEGPQLKRPPEYVHIVARQKHQGFEVGDTITGRARLSPPSGPAFFGANDFAFDAYFNGIGATGFFYSAPKIFEGAAAFECRSTLLLCLDRHLYTLRAAIALHIRTVIGGDAGAFAASIITDERRAISPEVMDGLCQAGLAHIVAISGLNMALAAGIFFVGIRLVLSLSQQISERIAVKKLSAFLALLMTLSYNLISGFPVSAERAWIMTSVMLIAVILDRQAINLRNVALSALIILVVSPSQVMRASFQMSFAATIALVAIYGAYSRRERRSIMLGDRGARSLILRVVQAVALISLTTAITSVIGGLATAPFSIAYFNQVSTYGLIANLMAMPVMGLIVMPMALIAMLVMPLGIDGPFLTVMGLGMQMVIDIALTVSSWSDEQVIGRMPSWFLPAVSLSMLWMAVFRSRLALMGCIPLLITSFAAFAAPNERPRLIIHESGDLILVRDGEKVATNKTRPNGFIFEQWQRGLRVDAQNDPPIIDKLSGDKPPLEDLKLKLDQLIERSRSDDGQFHCLSTIACTARMQHYGTIIQIPDPALLGAACDMGDIIITPIRTKMLRCFSGAQFFSATTMRGSGTLEFHDDRDEASKPIVKAALNGKRRPWTMHRYYDWRSDSFSLASIDQ